MKLLVTGSQGQVAQSLGERADDDDIQVSYLARPYVDLSECDQLASAAREIIASESPDVFVNAAAYTAVDRAEDEPELARVVNSVAPGILAAVASEAGIPIVHLSTDYVFDGTLNRAYREDDRVSPLGVYGTTKEAGERAVREACDRHVILRTSWVYSPFGNNFLKTMMRLASDRGEINVVDDQWGCPTSALDIADGIISIVRHWNAGGATGLSETFHLTGAGQTTWAGFANAILKFSGNNGGPTSKINGVSTADYPTKAKRPMNSRLDCSKFNQYFDFGICDWRKSTEAVVMAMTSHSDVTD